MPYLWRFLFFRWFPPPLISSYLSLWLILRCFSSSFINSQGKRHLLEETQKLVAHEKCGLFADADMIILFKLIRVISQLTIINNKALIAVIHLLSTVGLTSFNQNRMMYATLMVIFENIFVSREVHDKERRDYILDTIYLERLKQIKQFF